MVDQAQSPEAQAINADAIDWPAMAPPEGFAERTVAAFVDQTDAHDVVPEDATPPRQRWGWIVAAVAVAASLLLWLAWPGRSEAHGQLAPSASTQTVPMAGRAIAVAQPGAALNWNVDADGSGAVVQDAGRVFYRVEPGGSFSVQTPAGSISVTGTCFEVEIGSMNKSSGFKGAALGAALASAVVVTVYEGGVVLANERGEVALAPGERGRAQADHEPKRWEDEPADGDAAPDVVAARSVGPDDAAAQLKRQARALEKTRAEQVEQEKVIDALRRQVVDLGGEPGKMSPAELKVRARKCAGQGRGGDCPFLDPDEDTLREMARCASVKVDFPGFLDNIESPNVDGYAQGLGLSDPADVAKFQTAADRHYESFNTRLREIFVELGGDPELAGDASAATMKSYIADQLDGELMGDLQRRVAEERAGLRDGPTDLSELPIEEQAYRLHVELGNEFERHVAQQLGTDRAHELRRVQDGWPGSTSVSTGDCIDAE